MGDARKYPEIRALHHQYATLFLPRDLRNDAEYCKQWVDNNLTYLDAVLLERYLNEDKDYMRSTWPEYHLKHACRLGVCPRHLYEDDKFRLSTATTVMHSCSVCYDPSLSEPFLFLTRTNAQVIAQMLNHDPNVARVGPCIPPRNPFDCWHNPERTPSDQSLVMPVHPSHIPKAPMYPAR
eukprot:scaffold10597_cov124-Isochrysis_galbana.AAC.8